MNGRDLMDLEAHDVFQADEDEQFGQQLQSRTRQSALRSAASRRRPVVFHLGTANDLERISGIRRTASYRDGGMHETSLSDTSA